MIAYLRGTVQEVTAQAIILDVGGVGYGVQVPDSYSFEKGKNCELYIHMHWNQENGPALFGFMTAAQKNIFMLIIGCSGMGPKIGVALLGHMQPGAFLAAVTLGDIKALSAINGIGPKKAESLVLQLRDKVAKMVQSGAIVDEPAVLSNFKDISEVLTSLNYTRAEINGALEHIKKITTSQAQSSFDELMRHALAFLSKKGQVQSL